MPRAGATIVFATIELGVAACGCGTALASNDDVSSPERKHAARAGCTPATAVRTIARAFAVVTEAKLDDREVHVCKRTYAEKGLRVSARVVARALRLSVVRDARAALVARRRRVVSRRRRDRDDGRPCDRCDDGHRRFRDRRVRHCNLREIQRFARDPRRTRWILRDPIAASARPKSATPIRSRPGDPMIEQPHEDFFASPPAAGAADPLAPGAVVMPIFSACAFDTQRFILLHVCVFGHVSSGAHRCVATSFCAASVAFCFSSSLPTSRQSGTGRQTSDGEQLPSFAQTDG